MHKTSTFLKNLFNSNSLKSQVSQDNLPADKLSVDDKVKLAPITFLLAYADALTVIKTKSWEGFDFFKN